MRVSIEYKKSLAYLNHKLAIEWHPTKNGKLKPTEVTVGCDRVVWWFMPYDDPETGKHFDFEWDAKINKRARGEGCPYISGKRVWPGYNDLLSQRPDLAKEWHPTKNGELKPIDVASKSGKKVWWCLTYDDPETGKRFVFEWLASVDHRVIKNEGCPFLTGKKVQQGFNDLATKAPTLAAQWHPTKNGILRPSDVTVGCNKKVWWFMPYDDPETGKHFDFEWEATVNSRAGNSNNCPYIAGQKVWTGYNDLATCKPELAEQWHPTKNGILRPSDVTVGCNKKVWWFMPYDDPETGKHFDFEWEATIGKRTVGNTGCPYITGQKVWPGYNDLAARKPELAKQWHPTKNGKLKPTEVTVGCDRVVWWFMPYDDPETGKHFDFEWESSVADRVKGRCPIISNHRCWPGYNDLATKAPELAKQWHPTKNGNLKPTEVTVSSNLAVWWFMPYDDPETGKHFDFEWKARVGDRNRDGSDCKYVTGGAVWPGYNDLATRNPKLAKQWHPTKNGRLKPSSIRYSASNVAWWIYPYDDPITGKHFDFEWKCSVNSRSSKGLDCPFISNHAVWEGYNDLATSKPDIAKFWHPTKNRNLKPTGVTSQSNKTVWWFMPYDDPETGKHFDFEWRRPISVMVRLNGNCPFLSGKRVWPGYNDLFTTIPWLEDEWAYEKNGTLKPTSVSVGSGKKVWWNCSRCGKQWRAIISNRAKGYNHHCNL